MYGTYVDPWVGGDSSASKNELTVALVSRIHPLSNDGERSADEAESARRTSGDAGGEPVPVDGER